MTPDVEGRIFAHLDHVDAARKRFDVPAQWRLSDGSGRSQHLFIRVAVRLDGVLGGGASIFITTPVESWEAEVYGHIEIKYPQMQRNVRMHALEWRPQRFHTNSADCGAHAFLRLKDRWHPYHLNKNRGLRCLSQGDKPGLAIEPPSAMSTFEEYLEVASNIWRCPDVTDVPRPEWTRTLI